MTALRLSMNTRDVLSQPSLWLDEDITAALRRVMESQRLGGAENLIRGEAIRFMQQQRLDEQGSKWDMVVFEQNEQSSSLSHLHQRLLQLRRVKTLLKKS